MGLSEVEKDVIDKANTQSYPEPGAYQIIETDYGLFLLNSQTGSTWRWKGPNIGWKYHTLPLRIEGATYASQAEDVKRMAGLSSE